MKVNREELLESLKFARIGLSLKKETLEQSNAFVFTGTNLFTFNDEIMTASRSLLDITAAVLADEFLKLLAKIPDDEVDISMKGGEVIIKGKKKEAGITCFAEIGLPFEEVPRPEDWNNLDEKTGKMLQQAARCCGSDVMQELLTMVHVTPKMVESCDNSRLFRAEFKTGFNKEVLLPGASINALRSLKLKKVSVVDGWAWFRDERGGEVAVRCSYQKYHDNLDALLKVGDSEEVSLPGNLAEIVQRAEVMNDTSHNAMVEINLSDGELTIKAQKDSGWYREKKRIKYEGNPVNFRVNPHFLIDVLERTRKVKIAEGKRMKLEVDGIQFVVALVQAD